MSAAGPVLITGCSSGIGRATAEQLARRGHTVYATARHRESLTELERAGCRTLALDALDEESMRAAVATVESAPGAGAYAATKYAIEAIGDALRFEVRGFGVDVIVIEPGPIRTEFTTSANAALAGVEAGPYAGYHAAVAKADAETDDSFIAGKPEQVARAIEKAMIAARPRPRYRVTPISHVLPKVRGVLGDRWFDALLRTQIKAPAGDA